MGKSQAAAISYSVAVANCSNEAAGAVRSLLGKDFLLPQLMAYHRVQCPTGAQHWHRDGGSIYTRRLDYLQVFYYPQDTPPELGPTELVPGTHFARHKENYMGHYGKIRTAESTAAPAGSIFLTIYAIWHRRTRSTATGLRRMLKYNYWRTAEACRDWIIDPNFNCSWPAHDSIPIFEQFNRGIAAVEMFSWLCGEQFEFVGGQSWPCECTRGSDPDQHGIPQGLRRYPDGMKPSSVTW